MYETNTVAAENQEAQDATPEVPEILLEVTIGSEGGFKLKESIRTKGKKKGELDYLLVPEGDYIAWITRVRKGVGEANFDAWLQKHLRQACRDATADALNAGNGEISDVAWTGKFVEQFVPSTRKSGEGVAELREKQHELFAQLNPLLLKQVEYTKNNQQMPPEEHNEMLQLLVAYQELGTKLEKKSRKGKTAATTTAAAA